jgi:hypothetical protein
MDRVGEARTEQRQGARVASAASACTAAPRTRASRSLLSCSRREARSISLVNWLGEPLGRGDACSARFACTSRSAADHLGGS